MNTAHSSSAVKRLVAIIAGLAVLGAIIGLVWSSVGTPPAAPSCQGGPAQSLIPPGGWQDSYDAVHQYNTTGYYEWWYLHAKFDNGYSCYITYFWRTDTGFGDYQGPAVKIQITRPDGTQVVGAEKFNQSESKAGGERCDVVLGTNFLRQEGNDYIVSLQTKEAGANLTFHRKVPPWKWSADNHIVNDTTGRQFYVIPVPRADVEGVIRLGDEVVNVSGVGYHDHNWGDTSMPASMGGWGWGHNFNKNFTYVHFWLMPLSGGNTTPYLYQAMDDRVIMGSTISDPFPLSLTLSDYESNPKTGDSLPGRIFMMGKEGDTESSLQINITSVIFYSNTTVANTGFDRHYYRRQGMFTGTSNVCGKTYPVASDNTINEYILFVPSGKL